jgi:hypothetical protein
MPARVQVELPDGRKIFIGGAGDTPGLGQVSAASKIAIAGADAFQKGIGSLGDLFVMLDAAVSAAPKRPDAIEMEFRAKLTADCNLWIVSGEGEAEFSVKMSWGGK